MTDVDRQMQSSDTAFIRFWQRIPVVIRAIIVGFFVFEIGVAAWVVIVGPLVPAPWSIVVMGGVLWLYWKYFSGSWWPRTTAEARRNSFRDVKLSASGWEWGILFFWTMRQIMAVRKQARIERMSQS